ncbi:hypothetical protein ACJX0J_022465, partial [Zea mays]
KHLVRIVQILEWTNTEGCLWFIGCCALDKKKIGKQKFKTIIFFITIKNHLFKKKYNMASCLIKYSNMSHLKIYILEHERATITKINDPIFSKCFQELIRLLII